MRFKSIINPPFFAFNDSQRTFPSHHFNINIFVYFFFM